MDKTKRWDIDTSVLKGYEREVWEDDYFSTTSDGKYGVFIYNIIEWRMMAYGGLIAIYDNKRPQSLLLNSSEIWVWFNNQDTYYYAASSNCLIFRQVAYDPKTHTSDYPFLIIKPEEKVFAFIPWTYTSIYYGLEDSGKGAVMVKEIRPKELDKLDMPRQTGEVISLNSLAWFNLNEFDNALALYVNMQRNK